MATSRQCVYYGMVASVYNAYCGTVATSRLCAYYGIVITSRQCVYYGMVAMLRLCADYGMVATSRQCVYYSMVSTSRLCAYCGQETSVTLMCVLRCGGYVIFMTYLGYCGRAAMSYLCMQDLASIEVIYVCNFMCYVQRVEIKLYFGELRFKKAIYYYYYYY